MARYTPGVVRSIGLVHHFNRDPFVVNFTPFQLGIIWLHSSALIRVYQEDMILDPIDWEYLTDHLLDKYQTLPRIIRDSIVFDCLDKCNLDDMKWTTPVCLEVIQNCNLYLKIMERRRYGGKPAIG